MPRLTLWALIWTACLALSGLSGSQAGLGPGARPAWAGDEASGAPPGLSRAAVADSLSAIRQLLAKEVTAPAEASIRSLLDRIQSDPGRDSLQWASALDLSVEARVKGAKPADPEIRADAIHALAIRDRMARSDPSGLVKSLCGLADYYLAIGAPDSARGAAERAAKVAESSLGAESAEMGSALNEIGKTYRAQRDNTHARPFYERALAIREKALGPDHPDVAATAGNLGNIQLDAGDLAGARASYERAVRIRERALGPGHPATLRTLSGLGLVLRRQGDLGGAIALYRRALEGLGRILQADHPELARLKMNLGAALFYQGDYGEAERMDRAALESLERALGPESVNLLVQLNSLGAVLMELGDFEGAEELFARGMRIRERALPPDDPDFAAGYNNLGLLYAATGRASEAAELHRRALAIWEKRRQDGGQNIPSCLNNLGQEYTTLGDTARARSSLERAKTLCEGVPGMSFERSLSLEALAILDESAGRFREAVTLLDQASGLRSEALGESHPATINLIGAKADALVREGRFSEALEPSLLAMRGNRDHIRFTGQSLAERQALRYQAKRTPAFGCAVAVAIAAGHGPACARVWDSVIQSRALLLDEMAGRRRAARAASDSAGRQSVLDWERARQRWANLAVRGPREGSVEEYRTSLAHAQADAEGAERLLAERGLASLRNRKRSDEGLDAVRAAVPESTALAAYARYELPIPAAISSATNAGPVLPVEPRYGAFVLRAGGGAEPMALDLGSAGEIDSLIFGWRHRVALAALGNPTGAREAMVLGAKLREKLWDPIARQVEGAQRVYVIPDGAINLVPIEALPAGVGHYLVERSPAIAYRAVERDLVSRAPAPATGKGFLAFGDADFDHAAPTAAPSRQVAAVHASFRGGLPCDVRPGSVRWPRLAASALEVAETASLWRRIAARPGPGAPDSASQSIQLLMGRDATEAAFKRLAPGARVLHVATHGFFLGACDNRSPAGTRGVGGLVGNAPPGASRQTPPGAVDRREAETGDPLLQSGIILAGANRGHSGVEPDHEPDDGILTAAEIAGLDLTGLDIGFLSGCDTGLGVVQAGEGVLGLRRAFRIAGARDIVISLWPVRDRDARAWVRRFYEERYLRGRDTDAAAQAADRALLKERRAQGKSTDPSRWAGFIAVSE